ncbi:hypothetical protein BV25DRAFT_705042 [Artomyces pyxidatus]|uniref:Uncharacterized protein n=1 Tax=Artomyces pyxidatus TaxID=48021 RepID=A0ACB8SZ53_9AGAM|nr:hypothetical protein BV25DRAFT_705042 [Artomyces pyxidatus]
MRFFSDRPAPSTPENNAARRSSVPQHQPRRTTPPSPLTPHSPRAPSAQPRPRSILRHRNGDFPSTNHIPQERPRHSLPDIAPLQPRLPSAYVHGARSRFVSLPVTVPEVDTERDRLARACGQGPLHQYHRGPPSVPSSPRTPQSRKDSRGKDQIDSPVSPSARTIPPYAPRWPAKKLVNRIRLLLRLDGKNIKDYLDPQDVFALNKADLQFRERMESERARMMRMRLGLEPSPFKKESRTWLVFCSAGRHLTIAVDAFAVPLWKSTLYSSNTAVLGGARHDLPIVVFACIEELYRTGIYQSGLFRDLPNRRRHMELIELFNTAPTFGEGVSLRAESTQDICALLSTFLKNLAEPIIDPVLFEPFWQWCVKPSVQREESRLQREESEEEEARCVFYRTGRKPVRPTRRQVQARARAHAAEDESLEGTQIAIAQDLIRLLPTHNYSLLVYLCAFFTQVPLCPDNGITFEDIGRIFGYALLGGSRSASRHVMVWLLTRWHRISEGLLDEDDGSECITDFEVPEKDDGLRYPGDCTSKQPEAPLFDRGYAMVSPAVPFDAKRYDDSIAPTTPVCDKGPSPWSSESSQETLAPGSDEYDIAMPREKAKGWGESEEQPAAPRPREMEAIAPDTPISEDSFPILGRPGIARIDTDLLPPHVFGLNRLNTISSGSEYSDKSEFPLPPFPEMEPQRDSTPRVGATDTALEDAHKRIYELELALFAKHADADDAGHIQGDVPQHEHADEDLKRRLEVALREKDQAQKVVQELRNVLAGATSG